MFTEIETGQALSAKKMRFRDYADFWINNYAIPNLSPKTYERYKSMLKARILPYLGNMYLDKIQPMHDDSKFQFFTFQGLN